VSTVLGVINTLPALILERKRDLALLRVLGMSIGEVRSMLVLESSVLGLTSTAAGLAMGYVLLDRHLRNQQTIFRHVGRTRFTTTVNSQEEHHGQIPDLFSKRGDGCARWRMGSGRPRRGRGD
jgi:ABC-type lipoprotein release transport system permease subunit